MTDTTRRLVTEIGTDTPRSPSMSTPQADSAELLRAVRTGRRRWLALVALAFITGAGAGAFLWNTWGDGRSETITADEVEVELITVPVQAVDLQTFVEFDGSLGFSRSTAVSSAAAGTLTFIPETGADLVRGDVLYEVDAQPYIAFYGELPSWRDLNIDSEDGRDITQLETNLWALGYTVDLDDGQGPYLTVDETYDWATAYAVEQWETDLGLATPDGNFERTRAIVLPGEIRVDEPIAAGTVVRSGDAVLTATITTAVTDVVSDATKTVSAQERQPTERVTLAVATDEQGTFVLGDEVDIELADGRIARGAVSEVAEVARRIGQGANGQVIDIAIDVITVPDGGLLEGPVTIRIVEESALEATAVPVRALVALAEGGYAVEVDNGSGPKLVGVETGLFSDGFVEVTGVTPGDLVVVPS